MYLLLPSGQDYSEGLAVNHVPQRAAHRPDARGHPACAGGHHGEDVVARGQDVRRQEVPGHPASVG